jgi:predicted kinase
MSILDSYPLSQEVFDKIYQVHKTQLKHLSITNPALVIGYSGVPGSGKTTLSKYLEASLQAIRINNDDIRNIITELGYSNEDRQNILIGYFCRLTQRLLAQSNKLIILDSSLDRLYTEVKEFLQSLDVQLFVIGISLSDAEIRARISVRETDLDKRNSYLAHMKKWVKDNLNFREKHSPDFEYSSGKEKELLEVIQQKLTK